MGTSRVIGLDIGTTGVRAAEVEFGSGGPGTGQATLHRFGQVALPLGAVRDGEVVEVMTVAGAIRQIWAQQRFGSKDVVIGVGNQRVLVRELDLPWMPLPQLKASLPFQVQELLPMSTEEALLDFYPTSEFDGPKGRTVQGMLVAAQRDTVSANVLAVAGAGLRPGMVDLNAFALVRSLIHGELNEKTVAIVDVGASVTSIVIAARRVPRLVRMLPSGGQNVTNAVASALSISAEEAEAVKRELGVGHAVDPDRTEAAEAISGATQSLVEAIRNTLVYYQGNNPGAGIEMVLLTGGGAQLPGFGQYLSSATRMAVSLGDPLAALKMGKSLTLDSFAGVETLIAVPVGLAYGVAA